MNNSLKKTLSILVPFLMVLSQYLIIDGISYSDFLLIIFFILFILTNKFRFDKNNIYFLLFSSWMIINLLLNLMIQIDYSMFDLVTRNIRFLFYLLFCFYIAPTLIDFTYFLKSYKFFIIFVSMFLILQSIIYYFTGYYINGVISGVRISNELYSYKPVLLNERILRANSLFFEPGYYAQIAIPFLVYIIFSNDSLVKNKIIYIVLIILCLILSTSGQGIVMTIVVIFIYLIINIKEILNYKSFLIILLLLLPFLLIDLNIINLSLERLFGSPSASSGIRIYRGFDVYFKIPFKYKIFGVGYGNIGNFVTLNNIKSSYDYAGLADYVNSISNILISLGLIGFTFFVSIIYNLYNKLHDSYQKIVLLTLIVLSFTSSIFIGIVPLVYIFFMNPTQKKVTENV